MEVPTYLPFGGVHVATGGIDLRFPGQWFQAESGLYQNWMRDYDPTTGRYLEPDPLGLVDGASVYGYALQNPGRYVDPRGEWRLPGDPGGLPKGWQPDPGHRDPNGERWSHPTGGTLDWHKGRPGLPGWRGKDHWHHNGGKEHLPPGTELPDPEEAESSCGDDCQKTVATMAVAGGVVYIAYRCVRMIPSLVPPLWPTIPANALLP